nr:integrase, catalytic region, zinc finger, CCHC-type, peptidase aspartic, catalytic [Tanacetum cinerariifolium]
MQVPSTFKQSTILAQSNTESTSDSNIIFYSKYMNESQYNTVQNSTLPARQDDLILSAIEQLKTQVVNCKKINQDNKQVNELLTAELERYRNQERILKEQINDNQASTSHEHSLEIETLKHTLSEHLKEKESLTQNITLLKNDFQKEELRNIDRELALEKQALGFHNPCYLKKAQQLKQKLYDGCVIKKSEAIVVPDTEETLMLTEESLQTNEPNLSGTTIVEVPKELPKVSMVNSCLKRLKFHLASFDMVVKERTTATAITEGTWGFEHTKACFRDDIIPFVKSLKELFTSFDQCLIDEVTEVQNVFTQMELAVEQHCEEKTQEEAATLREIVECERLLSPLNTSLVYAYSNTPVFSSTGVNLVSSASGSMSQDNTKNNRIRRTQKKAKRNKIEDHLRTVKSSLNKESVVDCKATSFVINSVTNLNSNMKCASCNGCLLSDNHDTCVVAYKNSVNASKKSKSVKTPVKRKIWKTTGKVFKSVGHIWKPARPLFTLVGKVCPLTRITTPTIVPPREPIPIVNSTDKLVVTLAYSRKPKSKKVVQIVLWYLDSGCSKHMTGDRSQLVNFVKKFLGTVKFGNDHVAKIMGYGDYQIGNVTISL